jgi:hypothetical protein
MRQAAIIALLALCGCVAEPSAQVPAAQVIVLDGVSYTVQQTQNVPYRRFGVNESGLMSVKLTGESGRAVWISGAPTLLDAFRGLTVFCEGRDPGPPAPDAPDTDMVPTVPGTDTFQFDGACS